MPIRGAQNFIHQETKIFGATNSLFFRNSAGVLTQLPIGTANQQLGIDGGNNLVWLNPATFSLADDSVTFAKMQNITSPAILGRTTAGAGDPESLTPSQLSAMLGLGNAATRTVGLANGNLVEVVGGKIDPILIPAVAMGTVQSVATNAAKLALTGLAAGEAIVRVIADETRGGRLVRRGRGHLRLRPLGGNGFVSVKIPMRPDPAVRCPAI